jgi:hypothetical protein
MPAAKPKTEISEDNKKLRAEIEKKYKKTPEELYAERQKRLWDAVQMKVPDRVPVVFGGTFFACKYAGIPYSAAYYDAPTWRKAFKKMIIEMAPDAYGYAPNESGLALEALDTNYTRWPGYNLPDNVAFQITEKEYMKEDEYDLFLSDPSDYIVRYWLPRVYGVMAPLSKMPPLQSLGTNVAGVTALFTSPEFAKLATAMKKAGEAETKWRSDLEGMQAEMASLGFPDANLGTRGGVAPPFSTFTNSFRTFNGAVRDMFRQPDKLKAALQKMLDYRIARAVPAVKVPGRPTIGMSGEPHRVSDEFFSPKQFEEFVWPYWKQAMEKTYALGYDIISMFFEGRRDKQIQYFLQYPKGSMLIRFAETDIFRAKEMLGDRACIMGNVPIAMLQVGSTTDVEGYCKKLIKTVGKNGGFILRCSTDFTQEAKPENVKAMIDSVEKYGRY